ncbi:hypothetical protein [Thioflexithrix psekupsensis]|uniref:Uncharacterized protein n=1 Tax=Thioflexithrix psekupsensis TaxID=1570016 RepID=A0A251X9R8_9GAMM|nr:hypothetical protein [Thioflexithrix psekupsensis]OUD14423.1 hypothetical protein TPSD3_08930 [Thioflexithrix psekupsensis]
MKKQHRQIVPADPESAYELMLRLQPVTPEVSNVKQPKWQPSFYSASTEGDDLPDSIATKRIIH